MHNVSEIYFIKVFFRILVSFFAIMLISAFVFNINDSVTFSTGEIIGEIPQLDVKAPFEAIPIKVFVKEGQNVKAGDTLMVLANEEVRRSYNDTEASLSYLQKVNSTIDDLLKSCEDKIKNLQKEKKIGASLHVLQKEKLTSELKSASTRTALGREKLNNVALSKLKIDSSLFKQNVISKLDITNSFDAYTNYKNSLLELEAAENQARAALTSLENEFLKTQNELDLKLIELREQTKELTRQKAISDKELKTAHENFNFLDKEIHKQYIVSQIDGEVLNLYNLKFTQNFINKGDILLSIVPKRDKFYAKVTIPQREVRFVKPGQVAHLKIDAYYYYEQGILKGFVNYIPERKPKEDFFVIINLAQGPNFKLKAGYSLRGEIIIERLKIYQFIIKKLLQKVETSSTIAPTITTTPQQPTNKI